MNGKVAKTDTCPNCGCAEFVSRPNQYDVLNLKNDRFQILQTEYSEIDNQIFCRECGEEVFVKNGEIFLRHPKTTAKKKISPYFQSENSDFVLFQGDCLEILPQFEQKFDMIFADPPYFLSNGGISCHAGKQVCVDKGEWDKSQGFDADNDFNRKWISACREVLKDDGTIWISGTYHNIFSAAQMLNELDFKILNCVTWAKTNPAPNLACRSFAHSTEFVLWARKRKDIPHYYDYDLMKKINGGKQMRDVWHFPTCAAWEKSCGKHPTQKPLPLLTRIVLASTWENALVLDPFSGSATTGIAANLFGRKFVGIEREAEFLEMAKKRRLEIEADAVAAHYRAQSFDKFCEKAERKLF